MSRRPRILLVSPRPPPRGGIATWTETILRSDLIQRYDVDIVNTAPRQKNSVSATSEFRIGRAFEALRLLWTLAWRIAWFRPALLHVNTSFRWALWRDGFFVFLGRLAGTRTVLHFRGGDFAESFASEGRLYQGFVRSVLRAADRLIALDHSTEAFLTDIGGQARVRYLANFVRLQDFGEPPDRGSRSREPMRILFVGWLIAEKGVAELLTAVACIPDVQLTLVGPQQDSYREKIEPMLRSLGNRVRVLPASPPEVVRNLYAAADVLVLPTYREGFPNVVLEAMAAALPVVATPVGAIPDAIRDGEEGLLVPVRDPSALETALRRLTADPALRLRMGRRARARVESEFSLPTIVDRLSKIYDDLLSSSTSASR